MPDRFAPAQSQDVERRSAARERVRLPARVRFASGRLADATIVDRSLKGLRVRVAGDCDVRVDVLVFDLAAGVVHEGRVVWKAGGDLGLSLTASHDVRTATGPQAARLRRLWTQAAAG